MADGTNPRYMENVIIVPIKKPDKDPTDPASYRPIALTSHLGKVMETMVNNRLVHYLETHNKFTFTTW